MKPCLEYATYYIHRYPKTEFELRLQLRKKGYEEKEIDAAMKRLKKVDYINDKNFTERYLDSQVVRKGKSLLRIKQKLRKKGVDKAIIQESIEEMKDDLHAGMQRKINTLIDKYKKKDMLGLAIISKIKSRGYFMDDIKTVIHKRDDREELDG